jgi:hypothetical protein
MRSDSDVKKAREAMESRIDRDEYPLLLLIWQSKRGALGAVCNEGKDPREADQNLEDVLASGADLDLGSFIKIQAARNAFAWVMEERDTI